MDFRYHSYKDMAEVWRVICIIKWKFICNSTSYQATIGQENAKTLPLPSSSSSSRWCTQSRTSVRISPDCMTLGRASKDWKSMPWRSRTILGSMSWVWAEADTWQTGAIASTVILKAVLLVSDRWTRVSLHSWISWKRGFGTRTTFAAYAVPVQGIQRRQPSRAPPCRLHTYPPGAIAQPWCPWAGIWSG